MSWTPKAPRFRPVLQSAGAGLALIASGPPQSLLDRLRSPRGAVDFIDAGVGDIRFWTFDVADIGITCGAVRLVLAPPAGTGRA